MAEGTIPLSALETSIGGLRMNRVCNAKRQSFTSRCIKIPRFHTPIQKPVAVQLVGKFRHLSASIEVEYVMELLISGTSDPTLHYLPKHLQPSSAQRQQPPT
jgi:hypothetical protein